MPVSLLPEEEDDDEDGPGPRWLGEECEEEDDTDSDKTVINKNSVFQLANNNGKYRPETMPELWVNIQSMRSMDDKDRP